MSLSLTRKVASEGENMKTYNIPEVVKGIIFDIDGTLYTSDEYVFEQVDVQVRHFAKLKSISVETARKMVEEYKSKWAENHNGEKISLAKTMAAFGIPVAESILWRKKLIKPEKFLHRDEKLVKTIESLKSKYKIICVTNNPVFTARKTLEAIGISEFFPEIIGLDSTGLSKPHYLPFSMALQKMGVEAKNCVAVGDRFNIDIELPVKMGMGGILVDGVEDVYLFN